MKKLLCMLFVMLTVAMTFADQLSLSQDSGPYRWELVDTLTAVARVTGTDSSTLFSKVPIKYDCGYALMVVDSMVNDSIAIKVKTKLSPTGNQYGGIVADNVSSADGNYPYTVVDLGIGTSTGGSFFDVVMVGLTATVKKKITRAALYRYFKK